DLVTAVQTCALPIWRLLHAHLYRRLHRQEHRRQIAWRDDLRVVQRKRWTRQRASLQRIDTETSCQASYSRSCMRLRLISNRSIPISARLAPRLVQRQRPEEMGNRKKYRD